MTEDELARYVERVVAQAPPLGSSQRDSLAALLRPTAERAAA